jgi:hypothetical protein
MTYGIIHKRVSVKTVGTSSEVSSSDEAPVARGRARTRQTTRKRRKLPCTKCGATVVQLPRHYRNVHGISPPPKGLTVKSEKGYVYRVYRVSGGQLPQGRGLPFTALGHHSQIEARSPEGGPDAAGQDLQTGDDRLKAKAVAPIRPCQIPYQGKVSYFFHFLSDVTLI